MLPLSRRLLAVLALAAASTATAYGQAVTSTFVINELDSVQTGGNTQQFVELFNAGLAPVDLSQYTLGFYDGSANNNQFYMSLPLTGMLAVGSYHVVGNAGVPDVNQTFAPGSLENPNSRAHVARLRRLGRRRRSAPAPSARGVDPSLAAAVGG